MNNKILVIDDDETVRQAFTLALEKTTYGVDTADCGETGLEKFAAGKFLLVFLDMKMPGINGAETLRQIRKKNASIPIYIVTAFHKEFFEELKAVKNDGLSFQLVRKPLTFEEIILIADTVLGEKKFATY
ncbi:MAG: response regulator [Gammaproteobacteria bacterium]|nr:response regulator [Gammaproteobacteria bacterium]